MPINAKSSVQWEARKLLRNINQSSQSRTAFFEHAVRKMGKEAKLSLQLTALHNTSLVFEDKIERPSMCTLQVMMLSLWGRFSTSCGAGFVRARGGLPSLLCQPEHLLPAGHVQVVFFEPFGFFVWCDLVRQPFNAGDPIYQKSDAQETLQEDGTLSTEEPVASPEEDEGW